MKPRKRVAKRLKASAAKTQSRYLPQELAELYRPVKKSVTLRLDADVLAWFQRQGSGYQTRINQALRKLMLEAGKKSKR